jgi:hypothetical protein
MANKSESLIPKSFLIGLFVLLQATFAIFCNAGLNNEILFATEAARPINFDTRIVFFSAVLTLSSLRSSLWLLSEISKNQGSQPKPTSRFLFLSVTFLMIWAPFLGLYSLFAITATFVIWFSLWGTKPTK